MDNLFEQAVSRLETEHFFKGEGQYYAHNPMDGGHCYGIRLSGNLDTYLKKEVGNIIVFNTAFQRFIEFSSLTTCGLKHVLANLFGILRLRKNGLLNKVDFDNDANSKIINSLKLYFNKLAYEEEQCQLIKLYYQQFLLLGSMALVDIFEDYLKKKSEFRSRN